MTLEEFDRRIAQINGLLASAGSKLNEAGEFHIALDTKMDRLEILRAITGQKIGFQQDYSSGEAR